MTGSKQGTHHNTKQLSVIERAGGETKGRCDCCVDQDEDGRRLNEGNMLVTVINHHETGRTRGND